MNSIVTTQRGGVKFSWVSQILFTRMYQGPHMHVCVRGLVARGVRSRGLEGPTRRINRMGPTRCTTGLISTRRWVGVHTQCTLTCVTNRTRIPLERRTWTACTIIRCLATLGYGCHMAMPHPYDL